MPYHSTCAHRPIFILNHYVLSPPTAACSSFNSNSNHFLAQLFVLYTLSKVLKHRNVETLKRVLFLIIVHLFDAFLYGPLYILSILYLYCCTCSFFSSFFSIFGGPQLLSLALRSFRIIPFSLTLPFVKSINFLSC